MQVVFTCIKVNWSTFRGSNSTLFVCSPVLSEGQFLKERVCSARSNSLNLLHSERPKLYGTLVHSKWPKLNRVLADLSAIGLKVDPMLEGSLHPLMPPKILPLEKNGGVPIHSNGIVILHDYMKKLLRMETKHVHVF